MQRVDTRCVNLGADVDCAADHLEVCGAANDFFVEHNVRHVVDEFKLKRVFGIDFLLIFFLIYILFHCLAGTNLIKVTFSFSSLTQLLYKTDSCSFEGFGAAGTC